MKKTILSVAIVTLLSVSMSGCLSTGGANVSERVEYTPLAINHFDILERPKKGGLVLDVEKFKKVDHKNWEYYVNLINTYSYEDLKEATKNQHRQIFEAYRANAEIMGDFGLSTYDQRLAFKEKQEKIIKADRYNGGEDKVAQIMRGSLVAHYDDATKSATLAALAILYSAAQDGAGFSNREQKLPYAVDPVFHETGFCGLVFKEPGDALSVQNAHNRIIKNGDFLGRATENINRIKRSFPKPKGSIGGLEPTLSQWSPVDPVYVAIVSGRKDGRSVINESRFSNDDVNSCVIRKKNVVLEAWREDRFVNYANVKDPKKSEKIMEVLTRQHYKDYAKYSACSVGFCGEETQGYKFVN